MEESDIDLLTYGYLLRYLGLFLLMSTCSGWKREDFWGVTPFDQEANTCAYLLGGFTSKRRFNVITVKRKFTNTNTPPYVDKFRKKFQILKAWNDHMNSAFLTSWEVCLNKSMSICNSIWTCPVWILCPQNTHPFGDEWRTAFCTFSRILSVVELVEGKAHPHQAGLLEFEDLGEKNGIIFMYDEDLFFHWYICIS